MKKQLAMLVFLALILAIVPFIAGAKDKASGKGIKIKNSKIIALDQRYITVERKGSVWKLDLAMSDPRKTEILSKYGIQVTPEELRVGDRLTFKARDFGNSYAVPSHMYLEKGSKAYKKKKGYIAGTFYGYVTDDIIALAHSNTSETLTANKKGAIIEYKGDRKRTIKKPWGVLLKGKWSSSLGMYHRIKKIKITHKHDNPKDKIFEAMD